ncbi:MAG: hypothetical protein RL693_1213, partial [Verrucomicrobiota bacterium]
DLRFMSHTHTAGCLAAFVLHAATIGATAAKAPAPDAIKPFLEKQCFECHDGDVQKGGLRLDNLALDYANPEKARSWIKVLDRVEAGEMPPKKKERPPQDQLGAFSSSLKQQLLAAESARQKAEGRVVLRRLNRSEYQNTMHDLFGVDVDLMGLLPEDNTAFGFDNIGEALNVSSVLLERYLEASDAAMDTFLIKSKKPETQKWRVTMMPQRLRTDLPEGKRDYRLSGIKVKPNEEIVFFNSGGQPITIEQFKAPVEGRYRFRISASAYQNKDKTLSLAWYGGSFDASRLNTHLIGYYDIPSEKPVFIEFEDYLPIKGTLKPIPYRLSSGGLKDPETYPGPGIAIQSVEIEGPIIETWPPVGYQRLLGELDITKGTMAEAEKALRWLVPRAFRRRVTEDEIKPFVAIAKAQLDAGKPFEEGLRAGIKAVLCSPNFLFLRETTGALGDFELASRLSYFLWSTMPDEDLMRLAGDGSIKKPAILRQQVERLLSDPRSSHFVDNFTGQWLGLRHIEFTTPDKKLYPEHDDALQDAMLKETKMFFEELLKNDLSVSNVIDSNFSILNERLAEHYGIPGVDGQEFRKVKLPPECHRGGVLTQAAILKITANGTSTSPVVRGNWVLKNIIGKPVSPPPPNIPAVEPDIRGTKTIREQIAKHRELESCAGCHDRMDPLGLALENYDVIGGWRENYRSVGEGQQVKLEVDGRRVQYKTGKPVDASGVLPDGTAFANMDMLKKALLADKKQIARCVTEKLLTYATGAGTEFADRPVIESILKKSSEKDYGLRTLIHEVVQSPVFLSK